MREAIGGTWIMGIVIVFVVLFSGFLAYSISYTKAFNVKNEIINYIEYREGFTEAESVESVSDTDLDALVDSGYVNAKAYRYILRSGYNKETASNESVKCPDGGEKKPGGYCLKKICTTGDKNSNSYYKVTTFIALNIPLIGYTASIPISGETRTIYEVKDSIGCD